METSKCCVCLKTSHNCQKLDLLVTKLKDLVPEVEWFDYYNICEICLEQLGQAFEFKWLCIRHDIDRKAQLSEPVTNTVTHIFTHEKSPTPIEKPFRCETCDKCYSTKKVLKAHLKKCQSRDPNKKRTFSCEVCNLVMPHAKQILEHCISEHSMDKKLVKPYTCEKCPMRFSSSANLIQHKKYHDGYRSHICSFCGKSYITKSDLTVHEYTHFNRRNYKCEFCAKAFNTNKNLRSHLLVVHTDSSLWKYGCEICSRRFPLKSGYDQHMRRHAGDKKFSCQICEKAFVSRSELQKHVAHHSVEKSSKCGHCNKGYRGKRVCDIHRDNCGAPIKTKKMTCELCPKTFFSEVKLERHLRTHSENKPFL